MATDTIESVNRESAPRTQRGQLGSAGSELFDSLLLKLQSFQLGKELTSICVGITSPDRGVGVSTIAAKLAIQSAERGVGRVLLVDANHTRPCVHKIFQLERTPGIVDHLCHGTSLTECIQKTHDPTLDVMAWGKLPKDSGAISPLALQPLFDELRTEYQLVLIDLPAIDSTGYGLFFANQTDGVILVVDGGATRANATTRLMQLLEENWVEIIGAVLNRYSPALPNWLRKFFYSERHTSSSTNSPTRMM